MSLKREAKKISFILLSAFAERIETWACICNSHISFHVLKQFTWTIQTLIITWKIWATRSVLSVQLTSYYKTSALPFDDGRGWVQKNVERILTNLFLMLIMVKLRNWIPQTKLNADMNNVWICFQNLLLCSFRHLHCVPGNDQMLFRYNVEIPWNLEV